MGAYGRPPVYNSCWSPEEDKVLREGIAAGESSVQISQKLSARNSASVKARATRLNLKLLHDKWTGGELIVLRRDTAAGRDMVLTALELGRTKVSVRLKAIKLGLVRPKDVKFWTNKQDAELRLLAARGDNVCQIAHALGRTRNSIIGRCHRQNIEIKGGVPRPYGKFYVAATDVYAVQGIQTAKSASSQVQVIPIIPDTESLPLVDLKSHHCRWVTRTQRETGKPATFCARTKAPGEPYCPDHARLVYRKHEARAT